MTTVVSGPTPGEWFIDPQVQTGTVIRRSSGELLARVEPMFDGSPGADEVTMREIVSAWRDARAAARLMVAAPKLLSACEEAVVALDPASDALIYPQDRLGSKAVRATALHDLQAAIRAAREEAEP